MRSLPRAARAYVCGVSLAGGAVVLAALVRGGFSWGAIGFLIVLYWVGDFARVTTKLRALTISATLPVVIAAMLLAGPWAAAFVCFVAVLAAVTRVPWFK